MNNTTVTSTQPQINQVKRSYTDSEWDAKESYYIENLKRLQLPVSPSTQDVQNMAIGIDRLLTDARIDFAIVSQSYTTYDNRLKIEERRQFVELKLNIPQQYSNLKLTEAEMKGVVASVISSKPIDTSGHTLYDLVVKTNKRFLFMQGIVKALEDKKDLLITHNGILKIESSVMNLNRSAS